MMKVRGKIVLVCLGLFALVSLVYTPVFGAELKRQAISSDDAYEYRIGRGDRLDIQVWKEAELSKVQAVRIDGRISMPLIGDVLASGKTINELKTFLEDTFREMVSEPSVSILLLESKSLRYYVIGKISQPGEYAIDYPISVLQAISRSGGFQEWAKTSEIKIFRRNANRETMIPFDYDALAQGKNLQQNILVQPGDTIIVP